MKKIFVIRIFIIFLLSFGLSQNIYAETKVEKKVVAVKKKRIKKNLNDSQEEKVKNPEALMGENNLSAENFKIEDVGTQAVLVLDSSRSMNKTDPKKIRDQGVRLFLQFLEPQDSFAIIQFSEESKVVQPFSKISQTSSEEIAITLKDIQNDGNFTDFLSGIELAESLFAENSENKKNYKKVLILMTDGQNDPNPSKHSAEAVKDEILKVRIPALKKKGIKVYSLALSDLADRNFLSEISKNTNGLSWYANELNEVHRIFSDLFLTLKKPQVLELTKDGFEIDSSANEATFFVQRKLESESITVIDPSGNESTNKEFPGTWKWFRGDIFDVITVPSPIPGTWIVNGGDNEISGFAKLLTNLNLEHDWPEGTLSIGDSAVLRARLTGDTAILNDPKVKDLIFYSYKIINLKSGSLFYQGKLSDSGKDGDLAESDNIFSTTINLNEEGDFKIFLSAISPTFSRQVHIPVKVSRGLISLEKIPANEFTKKPESFLVKLHGDSLKFKNRKVSLISELLDASSSAYSIKLEELSQEIGSFFVPVEKLKFGENKSYAVVSGINQEGHETRAKSEEVLIVNSTKNHETNDSKIKENESHAGEHVDEHEAHLDENLKEHLEEQGKEISESSEESSSPLFSIFGSLGPLLVLIFGGLIARHFVKKSKQEKGIQIEVRTEYVMPSDLEYRLSNLIQRGQGSRKRAIKSDEIELFSVIPELSEELAKTSQNSVNSQVVSQDSLSEESEVANEEIVTDENLNEEEKIVEGSSE
jgi:uncharacterized protein (TIGR03503 family)